MAVVAKKSEPQVDPTLVPSDPGFEVWKSAVPGIVALNRLGEYGRTRVELIKGHRTFNITPQERRMNQNSCARPDLDMFTNGILQPVILLDGEVDTPALRENPNVLDDKDIERIFKLKGQRFVDRLDQITNATALERLAELAREPRLHATVQQYEQIKARQHGIDAQVLETSVVGPEATADRKQRAVTPK